MERKPQQQTLSIRISETLGEFLERSKQVLSSGRGEPVSTSDVAKILLESAKDDQLDSRLEVADLQQSPTESLWAMRKKWEAKQALSRAERIFSGQYIQIASEAITENPASPARRSRRIPPCQGRNRSSCCSRRYSPSAVSAHTRTMDWTSTISKIWACRRARPRMKASLVPTLFPTWWNV